MKKKLFLLVVVLLSVSFIGSIAIGGGKSNAAELYLYQKCTGSETEGFCVLDFFSACPLLTEDVTPAQYRVGSGWGKLKYNLQGPTFEYDFEGHGLMPGNYTLIYYQDQPYGYCGDDFVSLGSDIAKGDGKGKADGNVHIKGSLATGDLPALFDLNNVNNGGIGRAKIWLVLSNDIYVPTPQFRGWNPSCYLFEEEPIIYTYTPN